MCAATRRRSSARSTSVAERRRREKEAREAEHQRAIDETGRVGYMAVLGGITGNWKSPPHLSTPSLIASVPEDEAIGHVPTVVMAETVITTLLGGCVRDSRHA